MSWPLLKFSKTFFFLVHTKCLSCLKFNLAYVLTASVAQWQRTWLLGWSGLRSRSRFNYWLGQKYFWTVNICFGVFMCVLISCLVCDFVCYMLKNVYYLLIWRNLNMYYKINNRRSSARRLFLAFLHKLFVMYGFHILTESSRPDFISWS